MRIFITASHYSGWLSIVESQQHLIHDRLQTCYVLIMIIKRSNVEFRDDSIHISAVTAKSFILEIVSFLQNWFSLERTT